MVYLANMKFKILEITLPRANPVQIPIKPQPRDIPNR